MAECWDCGKAVCSQRREFVSWQRDADPPDVDVVVVDVVGFVVVDSFAVSVQAASAPSQPLLCAVPVYTHRKLVTAGFKTR